MEFKSISNSKKITGLSYLGRVNSSAKLIKNQKVSNNYTYILYLAPASISGYNVCLYSTLECRLGCLNTSGRAKMETADNKMYSNARIKKTKLFFENKDFFMQWLIAEIKSGQKKAIKDGFDFSIRLNGTSDIDWSTILYNDQNIFQIFSDIQFYDYTKDFRKFINKPENYHLTFSYTGKNWNKSQALLNKGFNVAVVFEKNLPETFNGFEVINGDLTDFRPYDPSGVIVGLKFKKIANKEVEKSVLNSCFVVKTNDINVLV